MSTKSPILYSTTKPPHPPMTPHTRKLVKNCWLRPHIPCCQSRYHYEDHPTIKQHLMARPALILSSLQLPPSASNQSTKDARSISSNRSTEWWEVFEPVCFPTLSLSGFADRERERKLIQCRCRLLRRKRHDA